MSHTVHHFGKIKEVISDLSFEDHMLEILKANGHTVKPDYHKSIYSWFRDEIEYEKKFITHNNKIYSIQDEEIDDTDDIIKAKLEEDGSISYQLRFYNGGASFNECLEEALDKLFKTK